MMFVDGTSYTLEQTDRGWFVMEGRLCVAGPYRTKQIALHVAIAYAAKGQVAA